MAAANIPYMDIAYDNRDEAMLPTMIYYYKKKHYAARYTEEYDGPDSNIMIVSPKLYDEFIRDK